MRTIWNMTFVAIAAMALLPGQATAAEPNKQAADAAQKPTVMHSPPASVIAGRDLHLRAVVTKDWQVSEAWVEVRAVGQDAWQKVAFERADDVEFVAVLPAALMQPPGLEYFIVSQGVDGQRRVHFASAQSPHTLHVRGETRETVRAKRLAENDGHRSDMTVRTEATLYGRRLYNPGQGEPSVATEPLSDTFWAIEAQYTYRLLDSFLYDLRFGLGVMRGNRALAQVGGEDVFIDLPDGAEITEPGLNYGWSEANMELFDNFSMGGRLILGANEEGFVAGVGAVARIGSISGTHLAFGGELLQDTGNRGFMEFRWHTIERVPMGFIIDVTQRPDADANPPGTRLMLDVGWDVTDAFNITGRFGYAARSESLEGGPVFGLHSTYSF